jgi:hypothetical protein
LRADIVIYNLLKDNHTIFPQVVPQSTSFSDGNVYCVYNIFNTDAVVTKTSFNDYDRYEVQISFFSTDLNAAFAEAETARATLDRYTGTITVDAVDYNVQLIRFMNQELVGFDEDTEVFMVAADYKVTMTQ